MNINWYLKNSICFTTALLLAHFTLYNLFMYKFANGDFARDQQNVFYPKKPYTYLFIGDSHCQKAIDTTIIKQSCKWAGGGENNILRYYKIKHLLSNTAKPKYLLLSSDLTTYTSTTANYMRNYFYYNQFTDFTEWGQIRGNKYTTLLNVYKYKLFPYIELRDIYLRTTENILSKKQKKQTYSLAKQSPQQNQQQADNFLLNTLLPKNYNAKPYDTVALIYLKKTLDLCLQHNIKTIFIQYPLSSYLLKTFEQYTNNQNFNQSPVQQLIKQYPNTTILDYQQIFLYNDNYFADCQHLNPAGATTFSSILYQDIQNINP